MKKKEPRTIIKKNERDVKNLELRSKMRSIVKGNKAMRERGELMDGH